MSQLTHLDDRGAARMVDIGDKAVTERIAVAAASVSMQPHTMALLEAGAHKKGDVLAVARIAGIQAAKKCADLIPLCHPLMLTSIEISFALEPEHNRVVINAQCKVSGKTGVEMEALTGAGVAALTVYDMCKALSHEIVISELRLIDKQGGKRNVRGGKAR